MPTSQPPLPDDPLSQSLYEDLHRCAAAQMWRETPGHTLSATGLAHEAWMRLNDQTRTEWASRSHFLGVAALMMRRILVNHALAKRTAKREAELVPLTLSEADHIAPGLDADVLRVNEALEALQQHDERAARVVELKFFGGLELEEIAEVLSLSRSTVKRDWALARAWLHRELGGAA
jgi:RNA polymerase sigma-70 factor, ECF subfamily